MASGSLLRSESKRGYRPRGSPPWLPSPAPSPACRCCRPSSPADSLAGPSLTFSASSSTGNSRPYVPSLTEQYDGADSIRNSARNGARSCEPVDVLLLK
eukprot:1815532-Pleurochrysis_carterae.AAC.5